MLIFITYIYNKEHTQRFISLSPTQGKRKALAFLKDESDENINMK